MNIILYENLSERNKVDKELITVKATTGTLRNETDLINPIINFELTEQEAMNFNYIYIQEFNRFYFVEDIASIRNGLWEIRCHVDVLMTYRSEIRQQTAIIDRNETSYNLLQNDAQMRFYSNPIFETFNFEPFGDSEYYIVVLTSGDE